MTGAGGDGGPLGIFLCCKNELDISKLNSFERDVTDLVERRS